MFILVVAIIVVAVFFVAIVVVTIVVVVVVVVFVVFVINKAAVIFAFVTRIREIIVGRPFRHLCSSRRHLAIIPT